VPQRPHHGRKLLIASIGVATLNYVGIQCGGSASPGSGNLVPPPDGSSSSSSSGGSSGGADAHTHDAIDDFPVANLVALPDAVEELPVANLVAFPDSGGPDAKE
jgi:hypothetical protein